MLFLPGWACLAEDFSSLLSELGTQARIEVQPIWQIPGQALSRYSDWILDWLSRGDGVIVASSMGAIAALEAAGCRPAGLRQLILLSGCSKFTQAEGITSAHLRALAKGIRRRPDEALLGFFREAYYPASAEGLERRMKTLQSGEEELLLQGLEYLAKTDLTGTLAQINVPTHFFHGTEDRIIPIASGMQTSQALALSTFVSFPESGHMLMVQRAKELAKNIRELQAS